MTIADQSVVFDADTMSRLLGLPATANAPAPPSIREGITGYYAGWKPSALRTCSAGHRFMKQDTVWYDRYDWAAKPAWYRLCVPVAGTAYSPMNFQERYIRQTLPGWSASAFAVGLSLCLAYRAQTGIDLLRNGEHRYKCRFREQYRQGVMSCRPVLCLAGDLYDVEAGVGDSYESWHNLYIAAMQLVEVAS